VAIYSLKKNDELPWLKNIIVDILKQCGGKSPIIKVCKMVWENHENRLRGSGDMFFDWQYQIRWAATHLRKDGIMKKVNNSEKGIWELEDTPGHKPATNDK